MFHKSTPPLFHNCTQRTANAPLKARHSRPRRRSVSRLRGPQRLRLRGGIWHYRRRVPRDLVQAFGGPEVALSLRTDGLRLAHRRADQINLRLSLAFKSARARGASEEDRRGALMDARRWMEELAREWAEECLADAEDHRATRGEIQEDRLEAELEGLDDVLSDAREALALGRIPKSVEQRADELLARAGREGVTQEERRAFCRLLLRAEVAALERDRKRMLGGSDGLLGPADVPNSGRAALPTGSKPSPMLANAVEAYLKENERTWRPRTAANARSVLERFVQTVGPRRTLGSVAKEDVRIWREGMLEAGISTKTVNEYVGRYVGGFWNWALKNDHAEGASPAKGLTIRVRQSPKDERHPLTDDELRMIFSGDYGRRTGPERGRGATKRGPADYWLPLILLHTGCRPEEVAQLRLVDIEELDGVLCFRIRAEAEDQSVKTPGSWRDVPVHSFLVELGFLEYVAKVKEAGEVRLFPELKNPGGRGYVEQVGKRFMRRLRSLGITDKRKVLYSFRHVFQDRLYHADVQETVIKLLMGHTVEGETFGRYGGKVRATKLRDAVERLDFRGVLEGLPRLRS